MKSFLVLFVFIQLLFLNPRAQAQDEFELVQPESYAIRRFAEVVRRQIEEVESKETAERLIELRAQLAILTRRLEAFENKSSPPEASSALSPENFGRALRAAREHYQKKIERTESSMRRRR